MIPSCFASVAHHAGGGIVILSIAATIESCHSSVAGFILAQEIFLIKKSNNLFAQDCHEPMLISLYKKSKHLFHQQFP